MDYVVSFALFLPLLGFLLLFLLGDCFSRHTVSWIACSCIFVSFFTFVSLILYALYFNHHETSVTLFSWIPVPGIDSKFALMLDPLSYVMCLVVTGVGFLIHVYSCGYMDHEKDYSRYFACLNLFVFFMLLLVLARDLVLLFLGWEGVGLASYLLIGFWYQKPEASKAATKAFVVNRIGDFGFLMALLYTFKLFGTSDLETIFDHVASWPTGTAAMTILTALFFVGAIGKSAQLPLHIWLPDAMAGPTPVSALIHAATMVTAGVYLVVRLNPLYDLAPYTLIGVGIIGGVTALYAAFCAIGQSDLKRVLAYSTVSQLGFMFLACGAGAYFAAVFHLITHAFMKGLLFLSAGNIVHMLGGKTEMSQMGGLSRIFTKTHWFFFIGVLAMSGIPPLAAFFSKDLILEQEYEAGFKVLFYIGILTSFLTAFYLMRAYCLTFTGQLNETISKEHVHEAPQIMLWPLALLAMLSIFGGFIGMTNVSLPYVEHFLSEVGVDLPQPEAPVQFLFSYETWLSILVAICGVGSSYFIYNRNHNSASQPIMLFKNGFYIDKLFDHLFVAPYRWLAQFFAGFMEPVIFNGALQKAVLKTNSFAVLLQRLQNGQIRNYTAGMVIGAFFLLVYMAYA